jgi:predicted HTH domain antitoxin
MVGSRLPEELVRDLELIEGIEQTDRSSTIRRLLARAVAEWKRDYYARQYGDGKLSMARAAHEAGISIWEMMDYLRAKKIPAQYDLEAWKEDVATVMKRLGRTNKEKKKP